MSALRELDSIPDLFGGYRRTEVLVTLAIEKRVRRVVLAERFGSDLIQSRRRVHPASLTVQWSIGYRGSVLALNPWHPLASELAAFLRELGRGCRVPTECDVKASEWKIPDHAAVRVPKVDNLFGSRIRTMTLAALEALGGNVPLKILRHCIPGEFSQAVKNAVAFFVDQGVLHHKGARVYFATNAWTPRLRGLLRSYLKNDPALVASIKARSREDRTRRLKYALFGTVIAQRILVALAHNGPMQYSRLLASVKTGSDRSLRNLEESGVVATQRRGRLRTHSLNKSYPVYAELRAMLRSLGEPASRSVPADLASARLDFEGDCLFGKHLRTGLLLTMEACGRSGMDASTIQGLFPEHDLGKIGEALRSLEASGIVGSRRSKGLVLFSLDPAYEHVRPLRRLLRAMNGVWPHYAQFATTVVNDLYPKRRQLMGRRQHSATIRN